MIFERVSTIETAQENRIRIARLRRGVDTFAEIEVETAPLFPPYDYERLSVCAPLTATEARQLAAALVALADEIAPRPWDADPLKLAIAVIEGYQMEIRNSGGDYGINLEEAGFCQGSIYVDAVERIRKLAQEQP